MEETLWHKFTQHPDLQRELLETGSADLVFVSFALKLVTRVVVLTLARMPVKTQDGVPVRTDGVTTSSERPWSAYARSFAPTM